MTDKERYISFCKKNDTLPIFMQFWWLDVVFKEKWQVLLYIKDGNIIGAMPYCINKKFCFKTIMPGKLSPFSGIYINYGNNISAHKKYLLEKEICNYFISELKKMKLSAVFYPLNSDNNFSSSFFRKGYSCFVRYTYKLDISDMEKTFFSFSSMIKRHIKKATLLVKVTDKHINDKILYNLNENTFFKQNIKIPYSYELFGKLCTQAENHNQGKWFVATDEKENIHAALFIVWDKKTCYYLIGIMNEKFKFSNAATLLQYRAMEYANSIGIKEYDFEGSMIDNIENYFISFNTKRVPYVYLEKYNNKLYQLLRKTLKR